MASTCVLQESVPALGEEFFFFPTGIVSSKSPGSRRHLFHSLVGASWSSLLSAYLSLGSVAFKHKAYPVLTEVDIAQ